MTQTALIEGKRAPAFALPDRSGNKVKLSDITSAYTVLYFYPKDDTPGCTVEAQGFQALIEEFAESGATVVGISGGDAKTKTKFCTKFDLTFPLLSDSGEIGTKYGVYGEKKFMGRTFQGFHRMTFILDGTHRILKIYDKVKPETHPQEVLDYLRSLEDQDD